ncbi:Hint domain-containing protein [Sulfitobacter sp. HNIBRBA3233]|uniref:Hint domain-containing protein n=1 Tax=Sulfitobacter marinivivus TaxID=3158558 RepID=UPI0032DF8214
MPVYYAYNQTILGSQSTVNGTAYNYQSLPPAGATWSYSGRQFMHVVYEADNAATLYNGDPTNETVQSTMRVGQAQEQSTVINGTATSVLYDYTFRVSDGTRTYDVSVIDADLNNDGTINTGTAEQGYYLVFRGDAPPPDTQLSVVGLVDNDANPAHTTLGGTPICFAAGTMIETDRGPVDIAALCAGDRVRTLDHGYQRVRWIGRRVLRHAELCENPKFVPIRIAANALGQGYPERDLVVSPQHRLLVTSRIAGRMVGSEQVLVAAKHLLEMPGVAVASDLVEVTYLHILCENHEIVFANGTPAETLLTGPQALKSLGAAACAEIMALLPELAEVVAQNDAPTVARPLMTGRRVKNLMMRHAKNARPIAAFG